ncbi:uncharacterized LOC100277163 [Zea mays]|uniref:HNH endonuclease domain-containing protein n=1 Tax=Zea mays TaxID=4577 RepID=A0A1D6GRY6_MAIZE|nr:uncharacterized LOC100277163 [Zea mays]AQK65829.1 HNH endonuclease domain-containing protein [Zea mays]|eukprot:XP_020408834.1 uncharacterized protein LOC100277163 isoform X2 [Zea mays]
MGGPSSPRRENDGEGSGGRSPAPATWKERPRSFDEKTRTACWRKAAVLSGRHPERWRQDAVGNVVCRRFWGCHGCLCYEYDHIVPFSKGGESTVENCQILQTRVNRSKSDKAWVAQAEMQGFSCDIMFTDKELDIIEMAVYGDVIRPGKQCRCRTVAEVLGQVKPTNRMAACELPDKGAS